MSKQRASVGHNSIDAVLLEKTVRSISSLLDQRDEIDEDIKAYLTSAKEAGMKPRVIRALIKEMREDADKRAEREAELLAYKMALGPYADLPLGKAGAPK